MASHLALSSAPLQRCSSQAPALRPKGPGWGGGDTQIIRSAARPACGRAVAGRRDGAPAWPRPGAGQAGAVSRAGGAGAQPGTDRPSAKLRQAIGQSQGQARITGRLPAAWLAAAGKPARSGLAYPRLCVALPWSCPPQGKAMQSKATATLLLCIGDAGRRGVFVSTLSGWAGCARRQRRGKEGAPRSGSWKRRRRRHCISLVPAAAPTASAVPWQGGQCTAKW